MADTIYSADQIVTKTLFAKTKVPLKRLPEDSAPVVFTADPGMRVGTVYSWLDIKPGVRKNLYWMFYDSQDKPYYAEHVEGRFTTDELKQQGALTVKEQVDAQAKAQESTKDFIERMVKYGIIVIAVVGVAKAVLPGMLTGKAKAA